MRTLALILVTALCVSAQDDDKKVDLRYKFTEKWSQDVELETTFELEIKGDDGVVAFFKNFSPILKFDKYRFRGEGRMFIDRTRNEGASGKMKIRLLKGKYDGSYEGEDFDYEFNREERPEDTREDRLKGLLWWIFKTDKSFSLEKNGTYKADDRAQEAGGEVLDLVQYGILRLPDKPTAEGTEWEETFKTKKRQRTSRGRFELKQKSRLDKIDDGMAVISTTLEGKMVDEREATESVARGEMTVIIDLDSGQAIYWKSSGTVRVFYKINDPSSGEAYEIELVMKVTSTVELK